jgi:hypothetical protein
VVGQDGVGVGSEVVADPLLVDLLCPVDVALSEGPALVTVGPNQHRHSGEGAAGDRLEQVLGQCRSAADQQRPFQLLPASSSAWTDTRRRQAIAAGSAVAGQSTWEVTWSADESTSACGQLGQLPLSCWLELLGSAGPRLP